MTETVTASPTLLMGDSFAVPPMIPDCFVRQFFAIVPSDSENVRRIPRAIYVGTGGDIVAAGLDGVPVTFKNCPPGLILDIQPVRILSAGTTATDLVALV